MASRCAPTKKAIHVFASDFLPFPGCPRTAGGNRSLQIISALRRAGHHVTFSMPIVSDLAKRHLDRALPLLTADELWCCEHFFDPESVLNRVQPDIAIYCTINSFRTIRRFARDIVHIVDLYGPVHFEGLLIDSSDPKVALRDGPLLERRCRDLVEKLRFVDYLVTVSERQKYFWCAYCSLAGFSLADVNALVCPPCFEVSPAARNPSRNLTVVYAGGFYPWQSPDNALRTAAALLDEIDGATLHIFGGPHVGLPNEEGVNRLLAELQQHRCVIYHGYRPIEELVSTLSTAWCALELMEQNIERELAVTGRTVEFLSTGTPVIYNDYSTLSGLIQSYNAGWAISPSDPEALRVVFDELTAGGLTLVNRLSANAQRLSEEQFGAQQSMAALVELCNGPVRKRITEPCSSSPPPRRDRPLKVLALSPAAPGISGLLEPRVNMPLRALKRHGFIRDFKTVGITTDDLAADTSLYNAVLIQRAVPEYIYLALANHGIPFILDVDDNLLVQAAYRSAHTAEPMLVTGLKHASVVTVPTPRLVRLLEKYSGIALAHKAYVTPNALEYPTDIRPPSQPNQLAWIQGDAAALTTSRHEVVRAVKDFSKRYDLPVVMIGKSVFEQSDLTNQVRMGELDFNDLVHWLRHTPTVMGVAPLETDADQQTLDFIAGKSDLKLLLFDGYGHPGVYSNAPPYAGSPFAATIALVKNSYAEWMEAFQYQFHEGWRTVAERSREMRDKRHIDRVAPESWLPAIERALLPEPISGKTLSYAIRTFYDAPNTKRSTMQAHGAFQAISGVEALGANTTGTGDWREGANGPALEFQREMHRLRTEIADLRSSLSWRVTAPLRRLAKPFMERDGKKLASGR